MSNHRKMNGLDLFSGIGGIGVALRDYVTTIAYCERDRYAQSVLLSRMLSNDIDRAPIWNDVTSLKSTMLPNIDIIFGGFPCQDISVAGNGKGLDGERSGLFFEIIRLTKETNAPFVFLENVPAIRTRGLREVVRAFTEIGYDCRWTCLSAASVGAPHKRERWFLLAHSKGERCRVGGETGNFSEENGRPNRPMCSELSCAGKKSQNLAYTASKVSTGLLSGEKTEHTKLRSASECDSQNKWWAVEPDVGRVVNGLPLRVDRIRCLGNSVVPHQVKKAFEILIGIQKTQVVTP